MNLEHQWSWSNWWDPWPYWHYVEYNEDGHYGPKKFGKQYLHIGPLSLRWWRDK